MKKCIIFFVGFSLNAKYYLAGNDSLKIKIYGNIFSYFSGSYQKQHKPYYSSDMPTALIGFKKEFFNKTQFYLIYDVARTTSNIEVKDSANKPLTVSFLKGSDFTAYLKQAEVAYNFYKNFYLCSGQLLTEQYLTIQDKFWGLRYICFTFQEMYRFGNPADFGIRLCYDRQKVKTTFSILNGDGPFNKQDSEGILMFAFSAFFKENRFLLNFYTDYQKYNLERKVFSLFSGYESKRIKAGVEGSLVYNDKFINSHDYKGLSSFIQFKVKDNLVVFCRYDNLRKLNYYSNLIIGYSWQVDHNLFISNNIRVINEKTLQIFLNMGYKF
ncbi:MAG: hypothetical protein N3A01_05475 [Bacteroidales bacterium]|nr:hypothetical protein [Bacteroidales bacterium]